MMGIFVGSLINLTDTPKNNNKEEKVIVINAND